MAPSPLASPSRTLPDKSCTLETDSSKITNDELPANVNLFEEIQRLISFGKCARKWKSVHKESKLNLVKSGLYYSNDNSLKCIFCNKTFPLNTDISNHKCDISKKQKNIPIPVVKASPHKFESIRMVSFLTQDDIDFSSDGITLAKNGFYFEGMPDKIKCEYCNLSIRDWNNDINQIMKIHQKYSNFCPLLTGSSSLINIPCGDEHTIDQFAYDVPSSYLESIPQNSATNDNTFENKEAHPKYREFQARLKSYKNWPTSMAQKPKDLAAAGLFYLNIGDQVACFHCGGGIKGWEPQDDPLEEHKTHYPNCKFLSFLNGDFDLQKSKNKNEDKKSVVSTTTEPKENNSIEKVVNQPTEKARNTSIGTCRVCMTNDLSVLFLPCKHLVSCTECALKVSKCPVCRGEFISFIETYIP